MKKMYDIVIAIILAFGAIISVAIFSNTIDKLNKKNQVVIVKGYAQVDRPVEEYNFVMSIKSKAKDVSSVYNALYEKEDRISANIDYKYTKEDVDLEALSTQGYELTCNYIFHSDKLEDIKKIREEVNKISVQYKDVELNDIQEVYADVDENDLINQAIKDAKKKAYILVKENKKSLGSLIKIKQDKIIKNDKIVSVTVTVTYEIN
ncbi:SIMPL domain-containing protein [uncultured Sneathia sp.]|uniref:SIMPL domain-containing protein n=2 Tax=Sneathia TaxID=168808 RepID=UPI00258F7AE2|nr:SIMPL domain-containing protein [uncultured Sneathia sp.]